MDDWEDFGGEVDNAWGGEDGGDDVAANDQPVVAGAWDDEDADDDLLAGDDWDADPEEKPKVKAVEVVRPKVLSQRKRAAAAAERRRKAEAAAAEMENDAEAIARAKRLAQQRVEEADHELTNELFGGTTADCVQTKENLGIEDFKLESTKDYEEFTAKIIKKLTGKGSVRCEEFIMEVFTALSKHDLSVDACGTIKKKVTVTFNTKSKELKDKKKGNKKKKKELKMTYDSNNYANDYSLGGALDDDFDDFM